MLPGIARRKLPRNTPARRQGPEPTQTGTRNRRGVLCPTGLCQLALVPPHTGLPHGPFPAVPTGHCSSASDPTKVPLHRGLTAELTVTQSNVIEDSRGANEGRARLYVGHYTA